MTDPGVVESSSSAQDEVQFAEIFILLSVPFYIPDGIAVLAAELGQ